MTFRLKTRFEPPSSKACRAWTRSSEPPNKGACRSARSTGLSPASDGAAAGAGFGFVLDQIGDHADDGGVCAHRSGADHAHSEFVTNCAGFDVEVVDHLHVIGEKTDGGDDGIGANLVQVIADIRFEP